MKENFGKRVSQHVVLRSFRVLRKGDQRKLISVITVNTALGLLDLLAVALTGLLGSLAVTGVSGNPTGIRVNRTLELLHIDTFSFQTQAILLSALVVVILTSKTLASAFFVRKTMFFMSRRSALLSANLILRLLRLSLSSIQSRSIQDTLFTLTTGVQTIFVGILSSATLLISDITLLVILIFGLLVLDPIVAVFTFFTFSAVAFILYQLLQSRASKLGEKNREIEIESNEKIIQVIESYREILVRNRRDYFAWNIGQLQKTLSDVRAESAFMPYISKYVIEVTMILGAFLMAGIQFVANDAARAVATLMVFLAAGARIAPAVLRLQGGFLGFRNSLGLAGPTLDLIDQLGTEATQTEVIKEIDFQHKGFKPDLIVENVSLTYPGTERASLDSVTLKVNSGNFVAIVGPSGAGKSTLVDVILGVREPNQGKILISGHAPLECITIWPGAIGYIPQQVSIVNSTIRENVALGFSRDSYDDALVWDALAKADLKDFVNSLPEGLETFVGERGARLSGGQLQRIGIARAFFTKPRLLILDEATSALDGVTEENITNSIKEFAKDTTLIVIAHRLSTVKEANLILYFDRGEIVSRGDFQSVRMSVPDFDKQAKLMGL